MPLDHELTERLRGVAGLRALVGTRIRWVLLDADDALPAVTLQWVGGGFRERAMGRDTGDVRARLQVSCWAQRHDEAAEIAEPVRRALQRWPLRDPSYHGALQDIYLDTELDLYEPDVKVRGSHRPPIPNTPVRSCWKATRRWASRWATFTPPPCSLPPPAI